MYVIVCLEQLIICCFNFWIIIVRALHRGPIFSNFSLVRNITIVKIFSLYSVYFHKLISCFKIFWNFIDIKYWYRYIKYLYLLKYKKMQMIKEKNHCIICIIRLYKLIFYILTVIKDGPNIYSKNQTKYLINGSKVKTTKELYHANLVISKTWILWRKY